ncbi:MAG: TonB-dependent receptor [Kofleriaceae bacterium]|nr:TonB-dependent receptor [Kofleriaceae bacterium]
MGVSRLTVGSFLFGIAGLASIVAPAHAQPVQAGPSGTSAVDPADLPPLPPPTDDLSSSATVLAASAAEEDVVVGAAKREQSLGNVASAVTVVSADRIRRFGYRTVGEAVAGVAGVYLEDNRINASLGIRGLQIPGDFNTRILILIDGATVNEAWGASSGLGFENLVSIDDIARIEVIRGPVSSVYGANAFFGIINIVTRGASESSRAYGRISANKIVGVVGTAGFAVGDVDRQVRGSVLSMGRFGETLDLPDVGNNLSGDTSYGVLASLVGTYGRTFGQVRAYRVRRDSPFAPYDGDPADSDPYKQYNTQILVEGGHTRELSKRLTLAVRGYLNIYRFYDDIAEVGATAHFVDYGDAATVGAEARARYEALEDGKLGITAGAEANYNKTKSRSFYLDDEAGGAGGLDGVPLDFSLQGVYTEVDSAPTEWLGLTAGLRFDNNTKVDRRLSPRAALFLAKKEKYGLKLLYAEGFRNPSSFEGAFFDNTTFKANPDIGAERIRSFEAVTWAKPVPGLSTRLSAFYWDARDVIVQVLDPADLLLQFQNIGRFVTEGFEAELSYRNSAGWYAFGGAALARVGSSEDPAVPVAFGNVPDSANVTAVAGVSTPKLWDKAHLSTEVLVLGPRPTRAALDGSASPDAPTWVGLNAAIYVPNLRGFDLTVGGRNLIGTRDMLPAPGDYDRSMPTAVVIPRIPGEGRELYVKLGYSY